LAIDLLVVHVRAVGRAIVDDYPTIAVLLEVSVATRYRVAIEDDVVVGAATDAHGAVLEHEPLAEQGRFFRVDHDEAIVLLPGQRAAAWRLNDRRNPRLLFGFGHVRPPLIPRLWPGPSPLETRSASSHRLPSAVRIGTPMSQ
jgi:hypothetical protein